VEDDSFQTSRIHEQSGAKDSSTVHRYCTKTQLIRDVLSFFIEKIIFCDTKNPFRLSNDIRPRISIMLSVWIFPSELSIYCPDLSICEIKK
jgi:hypothetical protein